MQRSVASTRGPTGPAAIRARLEKHVDALPVLPTVVARLLTLDPASDRHFDEVHRLVAADPGFSLRVVAAANSASSAPPRPIVTLPAAIARLGSVNAANVVVAASITRVFIPHNAGERGLWRHALQVGTLARGLAAVLREPGLDPEQAYLSGLLHDVGRFVMLQEAPEGLHAVADAEWTRPEELLASERAAFGLTHAELGAMACTRWGLPPPVIQMVREHHQLPTAATPRVTSLVTLSDAAVFPSVVAGACAVDEVTDEQIVASIGPWRAMYSVLSDAAIVIAVRTAATQADEIGHALGVV